MYRHKQNGGLPRRPRGGNRPKILTMESGNKILDFIEEHPDATLQEMAAHLLLDEIHCI